MGTKENFFLGFFSYKTNFLDFIRYFVPEIDADSIQLEDLQMDSSTFADAAFGKRDNDILYTVQHGGREIYVYVLVEHQSKVDYSMAYRVLVYMTRLWERYAKSFKADEVKKDDFLFPAIIPVVYYEGPQTWTASFNFKERVIGDGLFDKTTPSFEYRLLAIPSDEMSPEALDRKGVKGAIRFFLETTRLKYGKPEEATQALKKVYDQLNEAEKAILREMAYAFALYLFGEGNTARKFVKMMKGGEDMGQAVFKTWAEQLEERAKIIGEERAKIIAEERAKIMAEERAEIMAEERAEIMAEERVKIRVKELEKKLKEEMKEEMEEEFKTRLKEAEKRWKEQA